MRIAFIHNPYYKRCNPIVLIKEIRQPETVLGQRWFVKYYVISNLIGYLEDGLKSREKDNILRNNYQVNTKALCVEWDNLAASGINFWLEHVCVV